MRYIHCQLCLEERSRAPYDVIVEDDGSLLIICTTHKRAILHAPNLSVAELLREIADMECAGCGDGHHHGGVH